MNFVEIIIKEIGNGSEPNEKSIDKGIWKSVERKTERRANVIVRVHKVSKNERSGDVKTATSSTRDFESSDEQTATPLMRDVVSTDAKIATPSIEPNESTDGTIVKLITKESEYLLDCIIG